VRFLAGGSGAGSGDGDLSESGGLIIHVTINHERRIALGAKEKGSLAPYPPIGAGVKWSQFVSWGDTPMDVTQALSDAENSLRDFIASVLSRSHGAEWIEGCGVSEERLAKWRERKEVEAKRQDTGVVEERLLYYADFYDLKTILQKHWASEFSKVFGDWKTFEVWLSELEKLRDPDAHRRALLPHQKHLVLGISGEIRSAIIRYRSRMETTGDCFPLIESACDSLGNIYAPSGSGPQVVVTKMMLRPGDTIDFMVTASDPEDLPLQYAMRRGYGGKLEWQEAPAFTVGITEADIGQNFTIMLYILSPRNYHASGEWDDDVMFGYSVLPPKKL
jgi:hypothetical protein